MEKELIKQIDILLVEDSEDDIMIIKRVFEKVRFLNLLHVTRSGEEAIEFISKTGKYEKAKMSPVPGLILLDIMMPGIDGFEVLKRLKADEKYKTIPVIMLTTSSREEDVVKSYKYGACSYITKPVDFADFIKVIRNFEIYWALVVKIPSPEVQQ